MHLRHLIHLRATLLIILFCAQACPTLAQRASSHGLAQAHYTPQDSARIVSLLTQAQSEQQGITPLYFARQFLGTPYVAHTLEVCSPERLVVNLQGFDCTTYVETCIALWLAYAQGASDFESYLAQLERIRYQDGVMRDYPSRLHYFSQWIDSNTAQGIVAETTPNYPNTLPQHLNLYYMSSKPHLYKALHTRPALIKAIRANEQRYKGRIVRYIPKTVLHQDQATLGIAEGDIIIFVTRKQGLDTSHLGFATWHSDGKLHALNASSLRKQVVDERQSLYDYLQTQRSVIGIRVLKVK